MIIDLYVKPKIRSAIKYFGGQYYTCRDIIKHISPGTGVYVEPYAGALNVLLNLRYVPARFEFASDINEDLIYMWIALKNYPDQIIERLKNTDYNEDSFNYSYCHIGHGDPIIHACAYICKCRMSRGGMGETYAWSDRLRGKRSPTGPIAGEINSWNTFINKDLPRVIKRIEYTVFYACDGLFTIERFMNDPCALLYCDPPFYPDARKSKSVYQHEMSCADHEKLLLKLMRCNCRVLLSGYHNELYDDMLKDWICIDRDMPSHAGQNKIKERRISSLWINPPAFPCVQKRFKPY